MTKHSGFQVCAERCDQCLFSPNRIVSAARMRQLLAECATSDQHFICHKSSQHGGNVCCRGFYDRDPGASNLMRIMGRLGAISFVDPEAAHDAA